MRSRFAFIIGLFFLSMPGCMYHGGYYPNGYYGPGPSVLPAQPWTGYPSGPIYQPAGPIYQPGVPMNSPGGPTPMNPGTSGQPTDSNPPTTYGNPPGGTNNAPGYNPNPTNPGGTSVPNPGDDDGYNRQQPGGGGAQRPTITPTSSQKDDLSSPFDQKDTTRLERKFNNAPVAEEESPFETPVVQQTSGTGGSDVRQANDQTEASPVSFKTYANDPRFAWVQGKVEYDDPSNTWVIMYNDNPRTSDPYGGELTLADDPSLARFRTGDVVRIYGSVDPSDKDSRGKPTFRMTRAQPVKSAAR